MDISGQVLGVTGRNVNTRFGAKIAYDVAFSDGKTYTAWKADIATKAQQLQGQQVDIRAEHKQNTGNDGTVYDNYTLLDIAPVGQLAAAAIAQANQPFIVPNGATAPVIPSNIPIQPSGGGGMSPERESKIVKQSCLSTAFNFVGQLYNGDATDFDGTTEIALELAKTLYAEVYGQENVAATPETVAAAVNEVVPEAVKVGADTPAW